MSASRDGTAKWPDRDHLLTRATKSRLRRSVADLGLKAADRRAAANVRFLLSPTPMRPVRVRPQLCLALL